MLLCHVLDINIENLQAKKVADKKHGLCMEFASCIRPVNGLKLATTSHECLS